jgi:hypothetical protein
MPLESGETKEECEQEIQLEWEWNINHGYEQS